MRSILRLNSPRPSLTPALGAVFGLALSAVAHEVPEYEHEIRPILAQRCGGAGCHINERTSGVELTSFQTIISSVGEQYGANVVVPGDAVASPLVDKIMNVEPAHGERMPYGGDPLSAAEIIAIVDWINEGAVRANALQRGDFDEDGELAMTDAIRMLDYLFRGQTPSGCMLLADANGDGRTDVSDPVYLLVHLFVGGPAPAFLWEEQEGVCRAAGELSFASLYEKVFAASCAFSSCHGDEAKKADLALGSLDTAWAHLVGAEPFNPVARDSGMLRVDPGRPENSFLIRKLTQPGPGEGNRMPANSPMPLSESIVDGFREWILAGAPREGTIPGVPDITDDPPPPIDRMPVPPAPAPGEGVQLRVPPFAIGPRRERQIHYFIGRPFVDLEREEIIVKRIDIHMMEQSHHFILYQWVGSAEPRSGVREGSFFDVRSMRNIATSQQSFFSLAFPDGLGIRFDKDEAFDLNSHYVNLNGSQTLMGEVYVNIFFAEPEEIETEVLPIFDFGGDIFVPPFATRSATGIFPSGSTLVDDPRLGASSGRVARETHIYALTSHTHRHGDRFTVTRTRNRQPVGDLIYDNYNWDDPLFTIFAEPLVLEPGEGLLYEATYTYHDPPSPNAPALRWGPTSEDEMIILLGYYAVPD